MAQTRSWQEHWDFGARLLKKKTGQDVETWNRRIKSKFFDSEQSLRAWLSEQGVDGYPQSLLVMERFGYPDHFLSSAEDLINAQYADRPLLRPILDAIIAAISGFGEIIIQARKGYVSLRTPRRTFARVQATTKNRVDLALRLTGHKSGRRLKPSKIHETTNLQVSLASLKELDAQVIDWLRDAYEQSS